MWCVRGVAALLLTVLLSGGVFLDKSAAADELTQQLRGLPGVAEAADEYGHSIINGHFFRMAVVLQPGVTADEAAQVARTYVDQVTEAGIDGQVWMSLKDAEGNQLEVFPGSSLTADDAAASAARFVIAAHSPAVQSISMKVTSNRTAEITLSSPLDAPALDELIAREPALEAATWTLSGAPPGGHSAGEFESWAGIPGGTPLQVWNALLENMNDVDDYVAFRSGPESYGVSVHFVVSAQEELAEAAHLFAQELTRLDRPAQLTITSNSEPELDVTVGGCSERSADHVPSQLEQQLAAEFETC